MLVIGDAVCAFNPVYAQGMPVAARSALLLDRCLNGNGDELTGRARRYHRKLRKLHNQPWLLASGLDRNDPDTTGSAVPSTSRQLVRNVDRVLAAGTWNPRAQAAFLGVLSMTRHPATLFRPSLLLPPARQDSDSARDAATASPTLDVNGRGMI